MFEKKKERQTVLTLATEKKDQILMNCEQFYGGVRGVMVIVVGNGHGDTSSNTGRDWLHFT